MDKLKIKLPFSGFYESAHDAILDRALESLFEDDQGNSDMPDDFSKHYDYRKIMEEYAKEYVDCFKEWLSHELDIEIPSLEFESLYSPKFYNFETDEITALISPQDVIALYDMVDAGKLEEVVQERHTSRSGFASFYTNDLSLWLEKPVIEWDCIELSSLLIAAMQTVKETDQYEPDAWDVMERASCNGVIDSIVEQAITEEGMALVNQHYERRTAAA